MFLMVKRQILSNLPLRWLIYWLCLNSTSQSSNLRPGKRPPVNTQTSVEAFILGSSYFHSLHYHKVKQ